MTAATIIQGSSIGCSRSVAPIYQTLALAAVAPAAVALAAVGRLELVEALQQVEWVPRVEAQAVAEAQVGRSLALAGSGALQWLATGAGDRIRLAVRLKEGRPAAVTVAQSGCQPLGPLLLRLGPRQ
jgi:hypothetical protein